METLPKDALEGITVLDFSTLLPGPMATKMLQEAGAKILKIEPPGGEDMRRFPPFLPDGTGACYAELNAGKEIREIDLKSPDAMATLEPLIKEADVLIEQFRPGVMARLGLDYETVSALNPKIVYCSITGYGQTGPNAQKPGHDLNYMAESGLLSLTAGTDGLPILPPVLTADIGGGTLPAVYRIALALYRRDRTGEGSHLDVSMIDNLTPFRWWADAIEKATGRAPGPGDWLLNGGSPRYGIYPTKDDGAVAVGALEDKFWHALCEAVGLPEELWDDRRDPGSTRTALGARLISRSADDWKPVLQAADCCASVLGPMKNSF